LTDKDGVVAEGIFATGISGSSIVSCWLLPTLYAKRQAHSDGEFSCKRIPRDPNPTAGARGTAGAHALDFGVGEYDGAKRIKQVFGRTGIFGFLGPQSGAVNPPSSGLEVDGFRFSNISVRQRAGFGNKLRDQKNSDGQSGRPGGMGIILETGPDCRCIGRKDIGSPDAEVRCAQLGKSYPRGEPKFGGGRGVGGGHIGPNSEFSSGPLGTEGK